MTQKTNSRMTGHRLAEPTSAISAEAQALCVVMETVRTERIGLSQGINNFPDGASPSGPFVITLPWPSPVLSPNWRGANKLKWKAIAEYRKACADAAWQQGATPMEAAFPTAVEFCPPDARSYDDDNLTARFKAGRDGLADALGMDDKKFRLPAQIGQPIKGGAVRVTLSPIPA